MLPVSHISAVIKVGTGVVWLWTRARDQLKAFVNEVMTFRFHKMPGSCWVAAQLVASQLHSSFNYSAWLIHAGNSCYLVSWSLCVNTSIRESIRNVLQIRFFNFVSLCHKQLKCHCVQVHPFTDCKIQTTEMLRYVRHKLGQQVLYYQHYILQYVIIPNILIGFQRMANFHLDL
jgi:hypothetical protein